LRRPELAFRGIVDSAAVNGSGSMTPCQQRETVAHPEHPTELGANAARQAVTGNGVRYVLIIGLALVVIAFAIIYLTNFW
jgi:hypothetical protein